MPNLKDKVAIITGASSGIGAGTAVKFASLGCKLVLSGRNVSNLESTVEKCKEAGLLAENILCVTAEMTQEKDCANILAQCIARFGSLDILVNSAGILINGTTANTPMEKYDEIFNINVRSVFYMMQICIPHLIKSKGSIVNVSSVTGTRAFPGVSAYCMTKAAIDQLTRSTALELAADQVRVNAVNPGVIVTEVHKRAGMNDEQYQQFLEKCKMTHPMGRPGQVEEVAATIAFLASSDASFITGQTLPIDGGRSVACPR